MPSCGELWGKTCAALYWLVAAVLDVFLQAANRDFAAELFQKKMLSLFNPMGSGLCPRQVDWQAEYIASDYLSI